MISKWVQTRSRKKRSWLIDHGAAGKVDQGLLQDPHRVDVEVVGRLVQQDQVAAAAEHLGQVDAVPLAAGALADLLLLLRAAEVEAGDVGPRVHRHRAQLDRGPCRR